MYRYTSVCILDLCTNTIQRLIRCFPMERSPQPTLGISHGQTQIPHRKWVASYSIPHWSYRLLGFMALYFWLTREAHQTLGGGCAIDQWVYIHFYYLLITIVVSKLLDHVVTEVVSQLLNLQPYLKYAPNKPKK